MSTTIKEFTKEQLIEFATAIIDVEKVIAANDLSGREAMASAAIAKIALASLEAEPVAWLWTHPERENDVSLTTPHNDEDAEDAMACGWSVQPLYTAMLQEAK